MGTGEIVISLLFGAGAVTLFLDKVFNAMKNRGLDPHLMQKQLEDLYEWHNIANEDGTKSWIVTREMREDLKRTKESTEALTHLVRELNIEVKRLNNGNRNHHS